jgi:hypothetical protein
MKTNNMTTLTKELYLSPLKDRNEEKYGLSSDQCICCGKPMKKGERLYVHMNIDWVAVNPSIPTEDFLSITGAESHGCFPIGNDCAKKMKGFTFALTGI